MTVLKNILVPTDFSQNSSNSIRYACDLARESNARLHLLHVSRDELDASDHEKRLERLSSSVDARSELELDTVKKVIFGNPAKMIADYAKDNRIDLLVMGTHGRTGLAHFALGSVAEGVLRESPCPVTVLGPHDGENATMDHAVAVLEKIIGDGLTVEEDAGRGSMERALVDQLRTPSTTAVMMVDELEYREWLKYENGRWLIVEGNELLDDFGPIFAEPASTNQAIELIKRAQKLRATDIHIDPAKASECLVRLRIDGSLQNYCRLDTSVAEHLINQFKSLAGLEISDPFQPLEGRVQLPASMDDVEVRLSSVPVIEGQAMALRILDPNNYLLPLSKLGLSNDAFLEVDAMLRFGEGLVLVTGPTGSGKTTTVYSMLETIGGPTKNIVSIEDPVEFAAPFVRQISVDKKHGLTLANGLKTLLRMDPDVLFVGEIRDSDTAETAMRAASSGKYVFSTLHTRDIASTISSLIDLGLEKRTIGANLTGILNQRLVRKLCQHCRKSVDIDENSLSLFESNGLDVPQELYVGIGCSVCKGRGFHGRTGIFEVALVDPNFQRNVLELENQIAFRECLNTSGMVTLQQDALSKAAAGLISFEEAAQIRWL